MSAFNASMFPHIFQFIGDDQRAGRNQPFSTSQSGESGSGEECFHEKSAIGIEYKVSTKGSLVEFKQVCAQTGQSPGIPAFLIRKLGMAVFFQSLKMFPDSCFFHIR